ncbi:MAG: ISNCY family transposase [Balneolaceae bacterium]
MGGILMSINESKIHHYFEQVKNKSITLVMAAGFIRLSYRQVKRLWKKFKALGAEGLISQKRNKPSSRRIPEERRGEIAGIISSKYADFKPGLATEKLEELHSIVLSPETVRKIMIEYKIWFPRNGKGPVHPRRERRACFGELLQTDASYHLWFEDRGPKCHLYIIIDDATSIITDGHFEWEETTEGYFRLFEPYFQRNGLPVSIYSDKRGVFKVNQGKKRGLTQFGRAMKELGVEIIYAHSAPAKGRVERAFETLQDRLVREMRLLNISTIEEGNAYIRTYLAKHNPKYSVTPRNPHNAHLPLKSNKPLKYILCSKYKRIVSKNLEVSYGNKIYQLVPDKTTHHLKKMEIDVIKTLEGEIRLEHLGENIKFTEYNSMPAKLPDPQIAQELVLRKSKHETHKQNHKHPETFSKVVEMRGYHEREELFTVKERREAQLRIEERRRVAREENQEILNDYIIHEEVL